MKNAMMVLAAAVLGAAFSTWMAHPEPVFAQTVDAARPAAKGSELFVLGTGGVTDNKMDVLWILSKVKMASGQERTMLAMYQADRNGDQFDLRDTRWIDPDLRHGEWVSTHKPKVEEVWKSLPKADKTELKPPTESGD